MLLIAPFLLLCVASEKSVSLFHTDGQWIVRKGILEGAVATATYATKRSSQGYNELTVHTSSDYSDKEQMYAAGFVDGYFSGVDIANHHKNMNDWYLEHYLDGARDYPKSLYTYLQDNIKYINDMIAQNPSDVYWQGVDLVMEQVRGITDGYNFNAKASAKKSFFDLFMYNSFGDLLDLVEVLPSDDGSLNTPWYVKYARDRDLWHLQWKMRTKCSGLVRFIESPHDIFVSQSAWFTYGGLTRVMKHLDLNIQLVGSWARKVSFSSYPGFVFSFDDFYETSNKLTIFETTFTNFNETLRQFIGPQTLLDWIRIVIAVRYSATGADFSRWFAPQNSGTYNNQWVVVDYTIFGSRPSGVPTGTVRVVEQLPGFVFEGDVSDVLLRQGYFGSYNTPWLAETIEMGNITANAQGDDAFWNSPTECCRANIFAKYAPDVQDLAAMKKLMKYNKYQTEELSVDPSKGVADPGASIAARYDLRTAPFTGVCFGQLDAKIGTMQTNADLTIHVEMGPTHDDQPVLDLDELEQKNMFCPRVGVPTVWNFAWQLFKPAL